MARNSGRKSASAVADLDGRALSGSQFDVGEMSVGESITSEKKKSEKLLVKIPAPNMGWVNFLVTGSAPYVQHKWSKKALLEMAQRQQGGQQIRNITKKPKNARDFDEDFVEAQYRDMKDGWNGIPCSAFRAAMISACRLVNFKMTVAKITLFVEADGRDGTTDLVRIIKGEPIPTDIMPVRNSTGVADLRNRPMWEPGWQARVRVRYDKDQFTAKDVANLLARAGLQVGIGEGRPDSKESAGLGWGLFNLEGTEDAIHTP